MVSVSMYAVSDYHFIWILLLLKMIVIIEHT
nr:MAG TPA: hypothetical protein [Caudoviricetes sp.]